MKIVAVTRSKSLHCSTLNSILAINMHCLQHNIFLEVQYVTDKKQLKKHMKGTDRLIFLDYGANINQDCVPTMCSPMPKGYHVMVFPAVKEGVDWDMFKRKTLAGTDEPAEQRGLSFDTDVDKQIGEYIWNVSRTEAVVWTLDTKPILKMANTFEDLEDLRKQGAKICACTMARCSMAYVHTCLANILETSGVSITRNG